MTSPHLPVGYKCLCGHSFPGELGAYGCPNCEGDQGPAEAQYVVKVHTMSRKEIGKLHQSGSPEHGQAR